MDGDLFMECEEEELEPWQQMYDDVDEEELEFIEGDNDNVCDASFTTAQKTAVPSVHPGNSSGAQQVPAKVSNPVMSSASLLTPTAAPVVSSVIPQFMVPTGSPSVPPLMPTGLVQGQQLIQIQTPTGLSTMLLPAAGNTGASPANAQQIFFTQGFPVQNVRPAQKPMGIVLNLQQGQMIRPITLLSGPGGQFFAPAMGMPQVVTQPAQIRHSTAPSGGATQVPASTFATVHIPATLTVRTAGSAGHATPVTPGLRTTIHCPASQPQILKLNQAPVAVQSQILQVNNSPASGPVAPHLSQGNKADQVLKICPRCGAQYKMPEALQGHMCFCCPDLVNTAKPSTSAGPLNPASDRPRAPTSNPDPMPKVVMLVDDFYYGRFEGEPTPVDSQTSKLTFSFKCILCPKRSNSNIRLMDHIMQHPEMTQGVDPLTFCEHCFRQFSTTAQLQHHMENVHGPMQTSSCCKICEWAFDSEPVFLHHMKSTHKPGEMPYICQVCGYRSSFYSDVFNHFRSAHAMTCNQLCVYCLKVFKSPNSYQQHFVRHQGSKLSHCNKCRLQFVSSSDRMEHKTRHHRTFRKPKLLEGLQPGTKVTIRAYAHHKGALPKNIPLDYKTTGPTPQAGQASVNHVQHKQHQPKTSPQTTQIITRKSTKQLELLTKFQKQRVSVDKQRCMECSADVSSFPDHYPTFVHCAVCPYSTCCSRSYADHMITNHAPSMKTNHVPLHKQPPPCYLKLRCAGCDFVSQTGDLMAKHLGQFPGHGSSNCTPKGSPKVGFINEDMRNTMEADRFDDGSEWGPLGPESDLDEAMAPVEDVATDTDDEEAEFEVLAKNKCDLSPEGESKQQPVLADPPVAPPIERPVVKEREDTLSVRLLRIVLFALCCGVRQAAKQLSTQPSLIRAWLKEKEKQLERDGRGPGKGEAVERMVEWVMAQREQQLPVNEKNLFQRASEIHSQGGHSSSFRISYDWAVSFMLQHSLGWQAVGQTPMVSRRLPRSMEDNINSYTKFTHKHIQAHNLPQTDIAAMDELSVFVDFEALTDPAKVDKEGALQLVGTRDPLVTIYLTALANGTMLPTLVLFKGQLPEMQDKGLPNSVLLKAKVEGFTRDEELALWESLVWRKHMLDQSRRTKGMLILDSHRGHMSKDFLTSLGATATLPAVVPAGCTCRLQPLEMCVRPVLQSFLLARWAWLTAQGGAAGATQKDLVQLLVAWLVEALACIEKQPDLLQQSFHLTDVVPGQRDQEMAETLAEIQSKLMGTLREALLGPENLEVESPMELVQEDCMGTEDMEARVEQVVYEEQDVGQGQVDEDQGCGKVKVDDKHKNGGKVDDSRKAAIEMDMDITECNILEKRGEWTVPLPMGQETGVSHEDDATKSPPLGPPFS
ncbi:pogo transposable element derived with ZNF domain b isoform X2 [Esox lucius]|uniref:Pogo transposable element derived with ZNF domain b n=1 Tax=Esox lucius TaxID=8010 RepID=A0AAY5KI80_ESOLU|nr:pogo transposable element derived with ZNF domain b isoform X2 [Esox lucius]